MSHVDYSRERDVSPAIETAQVVLGAGCPLAVKSLDDRRREVRQLLESANEMLARQRAGLIKGWLKGYFDILVVGFDVDNTKLGIILDFAGETKEGSFSAGIEMRHHRKHASHVNDDQALMLPRYVEIVECDQKGILPATPRFQIFDDGLVGGGQPLYLLSARVLSEKKRIPASADRELTIFFTRVVIAGGEPVYEKVQTASQAIEDRPRFCVDDRVWRDYVAKAKQLLCRLRIRLCDNAIGGYLIPSDQPPFENVHLGYGPLDAGVNIQEIVTHGRR